MQSIQSSLSKSSALVQIVGLDAKKVAPFLAFIINEDILRNPKCTLILALPLIQLPLLCFTKLPLLCFTKLPLASLSIPWLL